MRYIQLEEITLFEILRVNIRPFKGNKIIFQF